MLDTFMGTPVWDREIVDISSGAGPGTLVTLDIGWRPVAGRRHTIEDAAASGEWFPVHGMGDRPAECRILSLELAYDQPGARVTIEVRPVA